MAPTIPAAKAPGTVKAGDLVFQQSTSEQAAAISAATGSKITHCGIVVERGGRLFVAEASRGVQQTRTLEQWVGSGVGTVAEVKRVRGLTDERARGVFLVAAGMMGRPYDKLFQWDDRAIYCSELIYDAFERGAQMEIGRVQTFADMKLDSEGVKRLIKARYEARHIPFRTDEQIITPAAVAASSLLEKVATLRAGP